MNSPKTGLNTTPEAAAVGRRRQGAAGVAARWTGHLAGRRPWPRPEVGAAGGRGRRAGAAASAGAPASSAWPAAGARGVQARPAHVAVVLQAVDAGAEGRVLALAARAAALVAHLVVQHVRLHLGLRCVLCRNYWAKHKVDRKRHFEPNLRYSLE